jgi:hypothetical protein
MWLGTYSHVKGTYNLNSQRHGTTLKHDILFGTATLVAAAFPSDAWQDAGGNRRAPPTPPSALLPILYRALLRRRRLGRWQRAWCRLPTTTSCSGVLYFAPLRLLVTLAPHPRTPTTPSPPTVWRRSASWSSSPRSGPGRLRPRLRARLLLRHRWKPMSTLSRCPLKHNSRPAPTRRPPTRTRC